MASSFSGAYLNSGSDFLPKCEETFDEYSAFSQSDPCPSSNSSFLSIDTSGFSFDTGRRLSIDPTSPDQYTASSASDASPLTPLGIIPVNTLYNNNVWPKFTVQDPWNTENTVPTGLWLPSEEPMLDNLASNYGFCDPVLQLQREYFQPSRPKSAIDPPLSRAVFQNIIPMQRHQSVDNVLPWLPSTAIAQYPQTIEPSATFRTVLPSSPLKYEPITPTRHHRGSSAFFPSSPISADCTLCVLPSQLEGDQDNVDHTPRFEIRDDEQSSPSLSQVSDTTDSRSFERHIGSSRSSATSKSGLNCDAIIPQNTYACGVPGCVDKDGRPKRFKRQEHRKRHEKTVHTQNKATDFRCWVVTGNKICGRNFSRRDNLKSHWKKTHGRKSTNQRNAYVATLDEDSKYYDENWTGPLTAEGLPIGHPKWPDIKLPCRL